LFRLTFANLLRRPARTILTLLAIALGVALVVSTTSGYASAELSVRGFINAFLGQDDVRITAASDADGIPQSFLDEVQADDDVAGAYGRLTVKRQFNKASGERINTQFDVLGVDPRVDGYIGRLPLDSGRLFAEATGSEAVIDLATARDLELDLGDTFDIPGPGGDTTVTVVGIIQRPAIVSDITGLRTIYVPLQTLQQLSRPDDPSRLTALLLEAEVGVEPDVLTTRYAERVASLEEPWKVTSIRASRETVDQGLRSMSLLALMGGMVSLLASAFIVFGTLSMGVVERQRTLAMLRSVGATRRQVAWQVVLEGLLLAGAGVVVGVPLGLLFVYGLTEIFSEVFTEGLGIGWLGMMAAVLGTTLAALLASAAPAWTASRVDPLAAMRPDAEPPRLGPPWRSLLLGISLLSIDILLLWPAIGQLSWLGVDFDAERNLRFWLHFLIGLPTLMLGVFLIGPTLIWLADRLAAAPIARLLGLPAGLLKQQLGGGLWRAAGTAAALMVGPAVLIVMNTQGRSGIQGWQLPDEFPDVFLFNKNGIPEDRVDELSQVDGIRKLPDGSADVTPIGYLNPRLGSNYFAVAGGVALNQTMFIAVEPLRIFEMMDLEFTAGSQETAARLMDRGKIAILDDGTRVAGTTQPDGTFLTLVGNRLAQERVESLEDARFLIVTEEFRQLRGDGPGDPFVLRKPGSGILGIVSTEPVEFIICGVVRSPGIDLMVSSFDLSKQFEGQSAASVFGTLRDAREVFDLQDVFLVAANLELGVEKEDVLARISKQLNDDGIAISDVRQLKYDIETGLKRLLAVAGTVAWGALLVSSLGVANTVMAGVRARRYQLGVMRAIGVTRGELTRLVLGEAVVLGLAAAMLGTFAGLLMAINARQLQSWTIGYVPPLQIAWDVIWMGVATVIAVSVLAALWPARRAATEPVLKLLQGGRAGT
jgi:putative ABC transport system permease protein